MLVCMAAVPSLAQENEKINSLQNVEVIAGRVSKTTPVATTNVTKEMIERENIGQDVPQLLSFQPSVTFTSDAGAGIGYTSLRIRGIDPSRINVTLNGIPMNDGGSHQLYWVNTGDLASSLNDIQIQRGAGSSTNGAGAFGASLNMSSIRSSMKPYFNTAVSYGSYNSHKETLTFGTGLLKNHWTFDARLSNIGSDGYVERGGAHLQSFFTQTGFFGGQTSVKFLLFGGKEKTMHAWNYVTQDNIEMYGRRFNSCGYMGEDANGNMMFYDDQTDNYNQLHSQLILNHTINSNWKINAALHTTKGDGYYEEYKTNRKLKEYLLGDGKSDLVRRKHMDNYFVGQIANAEYSNNRLHLQFGEAYNYLNDDHFGNVIWVKSPSGNTLAPNHKYYDNNSWKSDFNMYVKGDCKLVGGLSAYADLQYRYVRYRIMGQNDNWDYIHGHMQTMDIDDKFNFVNPKAGLNWQINPSNRLFASYAWVSKEPYRNCYTDAHMDAEGNIDKRFYPKAERMHDLELGYQYSSKKFSVGANFYYMDYKDQLVLSGKTNEIGEALTENVDDSYRLGIELQAAWRPTDWFEWNANATWSRNRVLNFTETILDEDSYEEVLENLGSTPIAMSPDWIAANVFTFKYKGLRADLQTKAVSKQYMSNAGRKAHALKAYSVTNLHIQYTIQPCRIIREATVGVSINNMFNCHYSSNGYAYGSISDGERYDEVGYSIQAPCNVMAHVTLKF